ncbi:FMN-dependent NADH-azoreductase [Monaibacterium marinum]|uniref:FMN dependent NADH:quinone oxidoreductase n=1 Tax=Pontivivens marinum TaxID=1690039 RepID=A0A2C9CMW1_9RHOB|nr:NAD(P)H-dependent oxidoreductase [Monaibacterium marinum]SOH92552.1 FMN-dependent NADH-azoreductase [Monaibacterium marinum]
MTAPKILLVQSSARTDASTSRRLSRELAETFGGDVTLRDVAQSGEFIDGNWVAANFTPAENRNADQQGRMASSDTLVAELQDADIIVIGMPVYNFGMPASLKAWIDQIARARVTFEYTDKGPVGLLQGKRAYVVVASGGTPVLGEIDFATPHLRFVLGFLGITDVTIINADQQAARGEQAVTDAEAQIAAIAAAA